jgi:hypothetical protein
VDAKPGQDGERSTLRSAHPRVPPGQRHPAHHPHPHRPRHRQNPRVVDPSLCDELDKEESSTSNSHNNFYEYKLNRCEGAAFARQSIGLSLRYLWEQLATVLNAYEKCLHAHADSRLKIDGKHAETPHENDAYSTGIAARAAQANRAECTNDGPADAALDSERKHSKRREASQAAEPATVRGDASKDYSLGGCAMRRFKGPKEIDEAASAALAAAHSIGTDGLTGDAATHSLL